VAIKDCLRSTYVMNYERAVISTRKV